MSQDKQVNIMFPPGRMVQGDLYTPNTTNAEGKPLLYKTGPNAGQPRPDYYFAVAIPKNPGETHWAQTPWGKTIWELAHTLWPAGQAQRPDFAWKISDGDSQISNKVGKKPCDQIGHAGNWIVRLSSSFAPKVLNRDGSAAIIEKDAVKCGYYVQVYATVKSNESTQTAGIHINHNFVAFSAYGDEIVVGPDPSTLGFGTGALPAGASSAPLGGMSPPATLPAPAPGVPSPTTASPPAHAAPAALNPTPAPNTAFVAGAAGAAPPPPGAPARVMLPAANGATYEAMIAAGWTDATLVQHGMMSA